MKKPLCAQFLYSQEASIDRIIFDEALEELEYSDEIAL